MCLEHTGNVCLIRDLGLLCWQYHGPLLYNGSGKAVSGGHFGLYFIG